ncbi:hypothetical protein GCM10010413_25200 [Promicromonospora sukumoe]|uniref:DUF3618 domain-containing protein n=1 Tax=Promicromonospora sukumoe TaxID=88382 RepID=A0A7W3J8R8_9MICO|nr:DUF3618 domain-containing protein [Promicromonospora sukumoe]MBA8808264.1 hypothetical protein [Promicromonospora sukumoe]
MSTNVSGNGSDTHGPDTNGPDPHGSETNDPEVIRADIERTREELSHDVDALGDRINPAHMARRQADRVRSGVSHVKERVTGSAHDPASSGRTPSARKPSAPSPWSAPDQSSVNQLLDRVRENPLGVGLVAFGLGFAVASLVVSGRAARR